MPEALRGGFRGDLVRSPRHERIAVGRQPAVKIVVGVAAVGVVVAVVVSVESQRGQQLFHLLRGRAGRGVVQLVNVPRLGALARAVLSHFIRRAGPRGCRSLVVVLLLMLLLLLLFAWASVSPSASVHTQPNTQAGQRRPAVDEHDKSRAHEGCR